MGCQNKELSHFQQIDFQTYNWQIIFSFSLIFPLINFHKWLELAVWGEKWKKIHRLNVFVSSSSGISHKLKSLLRFDKRLHQLGFSVGAFRIREVTGVWMMWSLKLSSDCESQIPNMMGFSFTSSSCCDAITFGWFPAMPYSWHNDIEGGSGWNTNW